MSAMAESTSTRLTYEDFLLLPDDGRRHEIIDGEHFASPSPETKHQAILVRLSFAIHAFLRRNPLGRGLPGTARCGPLQYRYRRTGHLLHFEGSRSENIQGPPDLVVEILSDATRKTDEIIKRKLYERFGVGEYWLIDPLLDTVKVLRRSEAVFVRVEELSMERSSGTLTTPLLPGFRVELSELFESE